MNVSISSKKLVGLSKFDEEEILKTVKRRALKECDGIVREYIECAQNSTVPFVCKPLARKMNDCVKQFTTEREFDNVRLDYYSKKAESGKL